MTNWRETKLKDLCDKVTVGHVGPMADRYQDSGITFLRSLNIKPFNLDFRDVKFIDDEFNHELRKSVLRPGDVVVVRTGYPGTAAVIPKSLPVSNCSDLVIVRPGKDLNPHFITAIFNSTFGQTLISGNTVGAAQQHFNITVAKELRFRIPPKPIQDKIAAILSSHNELIENNKRRIALLEKLAEEIYREWFVRLRFPSHRTAKFVKGIPATWKVKQLGEIANFTMGQSPPSEYYNDLGEGLPFHQGVGTYGSRFPQTVSYCNVKGRIARKGDILFSVRAPVGRLNIADCEMIIGRGLAAIQHQMGHNSFLFYLLKVVFGNEDIIGNGSIFNSVGKDELNKFSLLQPDDELVAEFEATASKIDLQIETLSQAVAHLITTRDLLMPRLISGKLSVENLDIQFPPSMTEELNSESSTIAHA